MIRVAMLATGTPMAFATNGTVCDARGVEAETTINRLDYGLAWNNLTEAGGFVVGHGVTISLQIEAQKQQADAQ